MPSLFAFIGYVMFIRQNYARICGSWISQFGESSLHFFR